MRISITDGFPSTSISIVEQRKLAWIALGAYSRGNADFGDDDLIERCGRAAGCESTLTFDRNAANMAGMKLLK